MNQYRDKSGPRESLFASLRLKTLGGAVAAALAMATAFAATPATGPEHLVKQPDGTTLFKLVHDFRDNKPPAGFSLAKNHCVYNNKNGFFQLSPWNGFLAWKIDIGRPLLEDLQVSFPATFAPDRDNNAGCFLQVSRDGVNYQDVAPLQKFDPNVPGAKEAAYVIPRSVGEKLLFVRIVNRSGSLGVVCYVGGAWRGLGVHGVSFAGKVAAVGKPVGDKREARRVAIKEVDAVLPCGKLKLSAKGETFFALAHDFKADVTPAGFIAKNATAIRGNGRYMLSSWGGCLEWDIQTGYPLAENLMVEFPAAFASKTATDNPGGNVLQVSYDGEKYLDVAPLVSSETLKAPSSYSISESKGHRRLKLRILNDSRDRNVTSYIGADWHGLGGVNFEGAVDTRKEFKTCPTASSVFPAVEVDYSSLPAARSAAWKGLLAQTVPVVSPRPSGKSLDGKTLKLRLANLSPSDVSGKLVTLEGEALAPLFGQAVASVDVDGVATQLDDFNGNGVVDLGDRLLVRVSLAANSDSELDVKSHPGAGAREGLRPPVELASRDGVALVKGEGYSLELTPLGDIDNLSVGGMPSSTLRLKSFWAPEWTATEWSSGPLGLSVRFIYALSGDEGKAKLVRQIDCHADHLRITLALSSDSVAGVTVGKISLDGFRGARKIQARFNQGYCELGSRLEFPQSQSSWNTIDPENGMAALILKKCDNCLGGKLNSFILTERDPRSWGPATGVGKGYPRTLEIVCQKSAPDIAGFERLDRFHRAEVLATFSEGTYAQALATARGEFEHLAAAAVVFGDAKVDGAALGTIGAARQAARRIAVEGVPRWLGRVGGLAGELNALAGEKGPGLALAGKAKVCLAAAQPDLFLDDLGQVAMRCRRAAGYYRDAKAWSKTQRPPVSSVNQVRSFTPHVALAFICLEFSNAQSRVDLEMRNLKNIGLDFCQLWPQPRGDFNALLGAVPPQQTFNVGEYQFGLIKEFAFKSLICLGFYTGKVPKVFVEKHKDYLSGPVWGGRAMPVSDLLGAKYQDSAPAYLDEVVYPVWTQANKYLGDLPGIVAWSVENEPAIPPAFPEGRGYWQKAFIKYLKGQYPSIEALNKAWGGNYGGFEELRYSPNDKDVSPGKKYDALTFYGRAMGSVFHDLGESLAKGGKGPANYGVKYTSCSQKPGVMKEKSHDPWGWAPEGAQKNITEVNIYDPDMRSLESILAQMYWANDGAPIISCETGFWNRNIPAGEEMSRLKEGWLKLGSWTPSDARYMRLDPWSLFGTGLRGTQYWCYSATQTDIYHYSTPYGAWTDATLETAVANAEFAAMPTLLSNLRMVYDVGLFMPRAHTLIIGTGASDLYDDVHVILNGEGFQHRPFTAVDADKVMGTFKAIVVPTMKYLERGMVEKFASFADNGGAIIWLGGLPALDEHALPFSEKELAELRAKVTFVPQEAALGYITGKQIPLHRKWKFNMGCSWPEYAFNTYDAIAKHKGMDKGMTEKWSAPEFDDSSWCDLDVPGVWENHASFKGLDGWGWYRTTFDVPADFEGKKSVLAYSLDDMGDIYLNGKQIGNSGMGTATLDVSKHLIPGKRNQITVRILDYCYIGGIRGGIRLYCPELPADQFLELNAALGKNGVQPKSFVGKREVDLWRTVLDDGRGNLFLLLANRMDHDFDGTVTITGAIAAREDSFDMLSGGNVALGLDSAGVRAKIFVKAKDVALVPIGKAKKASSQTSGHGR